MLLSGVTSSRVTSSGVRYCKEKEIKTNCKEEKMSKQKQIKKTKTRKYKARVGSGFTKKDAQKIGEELERIRSKQGYLTSKMVLESAKDSKSILHKYFEWKTSKAARSWRLQQARVLINHVVEVVIINNSPVEQRSFLSVQDKEQGTVYVTIDVAINNETYRQQLLDKMIIIQENLINTLRMFRDNQDGN